MKAASQIIPFLTFILITLFVYLSPCVWMDKVSIEIIMSNENDEGIQNVSNIEAGMNKILQIYIMEIIMLIIMV